jgi:hypothetical protein
MQGRSLRSFLAELGFRISRSAISGARLSERQILSGGCGEAMRTATDPVIDPFCSEGFPA